MRSEFEKWFKTTKFYKNMIESITTHEIKGYPFDRINGKYRSIYVQLAFDSFKHQQTKVDELEQSYMLLEIDYLKECKEKDELQKRVDAQTKHIEMALIAVKDIHKSAIDEFHDWDVLNEKAPKLCEHLQNLSVAVRELEQVLKGGEA